MFKPFLFLLLAFHGTILSAQELKPLPDFKGIKEKLDTIQKSFTNLMSFKIEEKEKDGYGTMYYYSRFSFCGVEGMLWDTEYSTHLRFHFYLRDYKADTTQFKEATGKMLLALKEFFSGWYMEELHTDKPSKQDNYYFYDTRGKKWSDVDNYLTFFTHLRHDYPSFSIDVTHVK